MSLLSSLYIGRNALAVQQAALQVTSNNIANAGNVDYTRQTVTLTPSGSSVDSSGQRIGNGVSLVSVDRQIDLNLQKRIYSANSDSSAANAQQSAFSQIESVFNALGSNSLSGQLSSFFNDWSNLASNPTDAGQRQVVISDGTALAQSFQAIRSNLTQIEQQTDSTIKSDVDQVNSLATQISSLNEQIVVAERGGTTVANDLRDTRDGLVSKLSQLTNVTTTDDGVRFSVFINSQPLVVGTDARKLQLTNTTAQNGDVTSSVVFADSPTTTAQITSGEIGGLIGVQNAAHDAAAQVDGLAGNLIYELNNIHASGQGLAGLSSVSSTNSVSDPNKPLNQAGLAFTPTNGSFVVTETDKTTGVTTSRLIKVNLNTGAGSPTTLNSLAASISDSNITATVSGGRLVISANGNTTIGFAQDTSGTLASLGINSFFTGTNANTIAVNPTVASDTSQIAAASGSGNNQAALDIAALATKGIKSLGGLTLANTYDTLISSVSTASANSQTVATTNSAVLSTLQAQRDNLSGVSLDEESVNLLSQQRAFQGAARIITTVDQMLQTVLNLVQ